MRLQIPYNKIQMNIEIPDANFQGVLESHPADCIMEGTEQEIGHGRRKKRPGKNRKRQQQADNAGHSPYRKPGNRRPLFRHYCR